ncbi:MAG: alpha/beta hydrolase family protein [Verrucomicrobiota bacterium]|nr:alpha/beta hydrolase family protein [Verrucomicrobiota bacterium]
MAFIQCNVTSEALGICCAINVLLPQPKWALGKPLAAKPVPVLYLLHGLSDDHTIWHRRTSLEIHAEPYNLAVVMPAVNRSFYTDQLKGYKYETFVAEELPFIVANLFQISTRREDSYVAGNSMGGYGAFKLALNYPERFAAAASFSGALDLVHRAQERTFGEPYRKDEIPDTFGNVDEIAGSKHDLMALVKKHTKAGTQLPRLYGCCGTEDFLLEDNRRFVACAKENGLPLTYEEGPGWHNWQYWDKLTPRVLEFFQLQRAVG